MRCFIAAVSTVLCLAASSPVAVFSDDDVKECTRIRTPELVKTGQSNWHVFATCCGDNACGHKTRRRLGANSSELEDNHSEARVIVATSDDKGVTWGKSQFLADGKKGMAGVNAIYDTVKNRVVVHYCKEDERKVYQTMSSDHAKSWSKPVELTGQLKGCTVGSTAGSRVQTGTGRLLWYSGLDAAEGGECVYYSDDHGATYKTHRATATGAIKVLSNEVSFAVVGDSNSSFIFANGRAVYKDWKPNRIDYVSRDDGLTWHAGKSPLKDPYNPDGSLNTEERSLLYADGVLYSAEPKGTKDGSLRELILSCSKDVGKTWSKSITINSGNHYAGYSSLGWLNPGKQSKSKTLLVVWDHEKDDVHTVGAVPLSQVVNADFC